MGIATQYEGGLKFDGNQMYITTSSGTTLLTLGNTGNATFVGTIGATNFSGSSSGTNTGDQTLSSLGGLPTSGGTVSGGITMSSTSTSPKLDMTGHAGADNYNYFLRAANDGGNKAVHFVNGSTRTADGGANAYTIRNDGGTLILGHGSYTTKLVGSVVNTASDVEIIQSDTSDHWALKISTNGSNNSGFWTTSQDVRLLLRDNDGNIRVDLYPDGTSRFYDNVQFDSQVTLLGNLVLSEASPTISLIDTDSEDDFYIHVNSNNFYVLRNTAGSENTVDGGWDSPHPLQLEGDTNKAYVFGSELKSAAYTLSTAYATSTQGANADAALPKAGGKMTGILSHDNRAATNVAHWSAVGNTTGSIKITIPGSHSGNWSMLVLRITAYEYNSSNHTVFYVSGHDWTSGWYNNGVTKLGDSSKDISLGYDDSKDYVILGLTSASWSYGHVTVDVMSHPSFYSTNMDISSGWAISQVTSLEGITVQSVTNRKVLTNADEGSGNGIDADTVDGIQAASFTRSDANDTISGKINFTHNAVADPLAAAEINGGGNHTGLYINPAASKQAHIRFGTNGTLKWQIRAPFQDSADTALKFYSWVNSADKFVFNHDGSASFNGGTVWTSTNDGASSGLDADTLDGLQATAFATSAQGTTADAALPKAGGTMTGDLVMADETINFTTGGSVTLPQFTGLRATTDLNDRSWSTQGGWAYTTFDSNSVVSNTPSTGLHNANGLLTFNTHSGSYMAQIAMTTNTQKLWTRARNGGGWMTWYQIFTSADFTAANVANGVTAHGWGNHGSVGYLTTATAATTYAPLASPALTGTPTAPTAAATVNTTQLATTAFVQTAIANLSDSAPDTLNTLNELAAALGDDASFSTTVTNSIAAKLPLAGGTMTGALKLKSAWNSSNLAANSFYVQNATDGFAFGIGGTLSSWFSWDSTVGQKRAIDVYNNGSKIILGADGHDVEITNDLNVSTINIGSTVTLTESTDRADLLYINSGTSGWGGLQIGNTSNEFIFSLMGNGNEGGIYDDANSDWLIRWDENGGVKLNYQASQKLATTNTGVSVTGNIAATGNITASGTGEIGGKRTYTKTYGSLNTTGEDVAGLVAGGNGNSALFTFTCHGHSGGYQKIVYSCYNTSATTWNVKKVIDEGTNDFDVIVSDAAATRTFTFVSRSGTKSYSPMVHVEHVGHGFDSTHR